MTAQASFLPDPDRHAAFYAGTASKRAIAWVLDTALTGVLTLVAVPLTAFIGLFFLPALYVLVNALYRWACLGAFSATPGMWMTGIEFRGPDGQPLGSLTAGLHTMGYLMSWAIFPCQIISVILMATGARGQGLTDLVLGTACINRPGHA